MISSPLQRKPRLHFETTANPSHVTFNAAPVIIRVIPWSLFLEARLQLDRPDTIIVEIGDWIVHLEGHNLDPLFRAIGEGALLRVQAHPEFEDDHDREIDSFVTAIRFTKAVAGGFDAQGNTQIEFDLSGNS